MMWEFLHFLFWEIKKRWIVRNSDVFCSYLRSKGIKLGENVNFRFPHNTTIDLTRPYLVEIGDNVDINDNFTILTHDFGTFVFRNLYSDFVPSSGAVSIGNNVVIGRDVTILKGVSIGDNCIIGLGSIVTKSIPPNSVATGVPCKVISSMDDYYAKRKLQSIEEAIACGKSLMKTLGKTPDITDFTEEWALFFKEEDFERYPKMHSIIDWRLKEQYRVFFDCHKPSFNGFDEFIEKIKE